MAYCLDHGKCLFAYAGGMALHHARLPKGRQAQANSRKYEYDNIF
jgi:hypothetical protein